MNSVRIFIGAYKLVVRGKIMNRWIFRNVASEVSNFQFYPHLNFSLYYDYFSLLCIRQNRKEQNKHVRR